MRRGIIAKRSFRLSFDLISILIILQTMISISVSPLHPEVGPSRVVNIKIAAELGLKEIPEWKMDVRNLITECSQIFKDRFGIQFNIEKTEYWACSRGSDSIWDALDELMHKVYSGRCDIVLGIIPLSSMKNSPCGLSTYSHGYVQVQYSHSKKTMKSVLLHELCHIFGAIDLHEPESIMNIENPGLQFDEFTSQIIRLNKDRFFDSNSFPLQKKCWDEAVSLFKSRAALGRDESEAHRMLALLYFCKQEYNLAVDKCKKVLSINPERIEVRNILGNIYLRQGEIDKAIGEYLKVLEQFPNLAELHFNLGLAYLKKGLADKAIERFQNAIKLNPHYGEAHAGLGYLYLTQGRIDPAIKQCQNALEFVPGDCEILCISSAALILKYDLLKKDASLDKRSSSEDAEDGNHDLAGYKGGEILEKAKTYCMEAVEANAGHPEAHNILGVICAYQGRYKDAEAEFLEAVNLKSDFIHAHHNLSYLYFKNGQWEKSAFHMKKIIDIYISFGQGNRILSKIFGGQKRYFVSLKPFE
jgi:tetratricopeptide (TPR) repeat protein